MHEIERMHDACMKLRISQGNSQNLAVCGTTLCYQLPSLAEELDAAALLIVSVNTSSKLAWH
jgi:hypothetical protein